MKSEAGQTSVVIPCYNGEAYLEDALRSVLAQTAPAREILVVDDGSRTPIRRPEPWEGPPLQVVRTPNRGLPAARNTGIARASGRYVALLDCDDVWAPEKLARQEAALDSDPRSVACFTRVVDYPSRLPVPQFSYPPPEAREAEFWTALWWRNFITPSTVLIRRDVLAGVGGFDESLRYCEDWEFWFRLLAVGRLPQIADALCYYRSHPGQMSGHLHRMANYRYHARRAIMARHGETLAAMGISPDQQVALLREEHRGGLLTAYFQGRPAEVRGLLWSYYLSNPADLSVLKYALVSLIPTRLLTALRG